MNNLPATNFNYTNDNSSNSSSNCSSNSYIRNHKNNVSDAYTWRNSGEDDTDDTNSNISSSINSDNNENECPARKKCKVTINNCVRVILIPSRIEYKVCGLADTIWYSADDLAFIKYDCRKEIASYIINESSVSDAKRHFDSVKDVMRQLYQPYA